MSIRPPMSDAGAALRRLVADRVGLDLRHVRESDLAQAVTRLIAETGARDIDELCGLVSERRALFEDLVADLTIGETHFLRDPAQLDVLENDILPGLIGRRAGTRRLRLWSAGCSTGEEAYTLAIIAERVLGHAEQWDVSILGTDINRRSLAIAERGEYGPWSLRGVPDEVIDRYFVRHGDQVRVAPRLRRLTRFAYLNLADDVYPSPLTGTAALDVVMCRNTLMYFEHQVAREVVGRLRTALADDGWLLVAAGEWGRGRQADLTPHRLAAATAFTPHQAAPKPAPLVPEPPPPVPEPARPPGPGPGAGSTAPASPPSAAPSATELYERAREHVRRLELDAAERLLRQELARDPLSGRAHWLLGIVLQEHGRPEQALEELRRCVFTEPEFDLGRFTLARLHARLGYADRAHHEFEALARRLRRQPAGDPVAEGDGLTAARLLHLTLVADEAEATVPARMKERAP